ncbi:unnamed protein product [Oncorhynchus mykiss]|uniref:ZU5 domain-containing protein n=1 Tax=Oncorhynchus mykiss TaxID=8022 RepID=A0A060WCN1_ONCMY|nr:unnamed protein product [Oncorhynchus mykiss]
MCVFCSTLSEESQEVLLSPEVTYGPPGLDLSCPVAMTIAHCAEFATDNWNIRLKRQTQDNKWEVRLRDPKAQSSLCLIGLDFCLCVCLKQHLRGIVLPDFIHWTFCCQELLCLFFICLFVCLGGFILREIIMELFLEVASVERVRGGRLLEEPKTLLFRGNSFSLQLSIQDIPQFLWSIKPFTTCQEFSFSQVWASNQRPLQCAFSLERYSPASSQLSCKISVRQVKGQEQILQVYTSVVESEKEVVPFFTQSNCTTTSLTGSRAFKIPLSIRQRICATFDTANAKGKDWQLLAQKLHIDR